MHDYFKINVKYMVSLYKVMYALYFLSLHVHTWRSKAPRRFCFFVWSAAWNKILTYDNLMRRGYTLTNWCCMCRCEGESVDHLLIHCHTENELWNFVFRSFGFQWVLPRNVIDLLDGWWNLLGKHSSEIWYMVPLCLMWTFGRNVIAVYSKTERFMWASCWMVFLSLHFIGVVIGVLLLVALL